VLGPDAPCPAGQRYWRSQLANLRDLLPRGSFHQLVRERPWPKHQFHMLLCPCYLGKTCMLSLSAGSVLGRLRVSICLPDVVVEVTSHLVKIAGVQGSSCLLSLLALAVSLVTTTDWLREHLLSVCNSYHRHLFVVSYAVLQLFPTCESFSRRR
jgi:hypothetical protein